MLRSKNVFWMLAVLAFGYLGWQNPFVERGGNPRNQVLSYDVAGYYAYLPMLFIERDLRLEKPWKYDMIQLVGVHEHPESGGRHLKFTMGMAVLYAPFFAAAHGYALAFTPSEAHGFSMPYRVGIGLAGVVYPLIGLALLRRFELEAALEDARDQIRRIDQNARTEMILAPRQPPKGVERGPLIDLSVFETSFLSAA